MVPRAVMTRRCAAKSAVAAPGRWSPKLSVGSVTMASMKATDPATEQAADEPESAAAALGQEALKAFDNPAVKSLGELAFRSFSSPVAEAIQLEAERRAVWADQLRSPLVESVAVMRPIADAMAAADAQLSPLRHAMAQAAKVVESQQDQVADVLRSMPVIEPLPAVEPSSSLDDVMNDLHAATAEREEEERTDQTATLELLERMVTLQDEILRRQDAQLEITRQAVHGQRGAQIAAHIAAVAAVAAVLVGVAPTLLLALPVIAAAYVGTLLLLARRRSD
jgi:hypothetical protein